MKLNDLDRPLPALIVCAVLACVVSSVVMGGVLFGITTPYFPGLPR